MKLSLLAKIYLALGLGLVSVYGVAAAKGWELGSPKRSYVPADIRQSPGGYRSFHFWHLGYHGGK